MKKKQERAIRSERLLADAFRGAITEIGAGQVLIPTLPEERAWNNACQRAISICGHYRDGRGLFQVTANAGGEPQTTAGENAR